MEDLHAQYEQASSELRVHLASWDYAFAMAGGCHGGAEHPRLRAVREEADRLRARCRNLKARLAEQS
jgi:hypothetical protein